MKITAFELVNFRSHKHTNVTDLQRINYFLGDNGSGKSSMVDAIAYALTGVCRGTDEGGRNAALLCFHDGKEFEKSFVVGLGTDKGPVLRKGPGQGPNSAVQQQINRLMGTNPVLTRALVDVTHFFTQDAAGQKRILEQALDVAITPAMVEKACGPDWPVAPKLPYTSLEDLVNAEKSLRTMRMMAKKMVIEPKLDLTGIPDEIQKWPLDTAEKNLGAMREKLEGLLKEKGRVEGLVGFSAERQATLVRERESLKANIARLTRETDATKDIHPEVKKIVDRIALIGKQVPVDETARERWLAIRNLLAEGGDDCPVCMRQLPKSSRYKAIEKATLALDQIPLPAVLPSKDEIPALDRRLKELERLQDLKNTGLREIERDAARVLEIQGELTTASAQTQSPPTPELDTRLAKGREVERQIAEYVTKVKAHQTALQGFTVAAETAQAYDRLVQVFGPNGMRQELILQKIAPFVNDVNVILLRFGLHLDIDPENLSVIVNGRPDALLSHTEAMRAGLCLQMALSARAGLKFVILDGFDALGPPARRAMSDILAWELTSDFQFLIFGTPKDPIDTMRWPTAAGVAFFEVRSEGGISTVSRRS